MYPDTVLNKIEEIINGLTSPAIKAWRSSSMKLDNNKRDSVPCALIIDNGGSSKGGTSGKDVLFNFIIRCFVDVSSDGQGRQHQSFLLKTYFEKINNAIIDGSNQSTLQSHVRLSGWGKVTLYEMGKSKFLYFCDYRYIINLNFVG